MRAVFHEQDDAEAVVIRLRREGWDAMVVQDRFAGEDDDEDHAWAVLTDAPETMLELLTEERDGWLDHDVPPATQPTQSPLQSPLRSPLRPTPGAPLDLPDGPRRVKGHFKDA